MQTMTSRYTRADYSLLPEGFPAQLIEGCLVKEPSPTFGHQCVVTTLLIQLVGVVGAGRVVPAPMDVVLDDHNVYQPDLVVLDLPPPRDAPDVGIPLIAIEIASPSSAHRDRTTKKDHLLKAGVAEVWIVDPPRRRVERHDADGVAIATDQETLHSAVVPAFSIQPAALFSD